MLTRSFAALLLLAAAMFTLTRSEENDAGRAPALEPGVGRELARWRAERYRDVNYKLHVALEPKAELLRGTVEVSLTLEEPADVVLDWRAMQKGAGARERVHGIRANGATVEDARFESEHIVVPRAHTRAGRNAFEIAFASPVSTSGSAVTRYLDREDGSEYVYTLFVPSDASTAFPCFDQPDLKARFLLSVTAPKDWTVVANAKLKSEAGAGEASKTFAFHETEPLSTYQFAFAAGPFAEFVDESSAYGTRMFVRRSRAERARKETAEVFRLNREALKFFEGYFDYKFPFSKYDLVIVPEFAYNGMEHAGATFLREESVLFTVDPTAADLLARADVMFHEVAHQWFGDLVTMRWFDDLWLKEGFATFMSYKAVEALMPEYDAWKVFHLRNKPLAYLTDVTKGTTPIWQEIANLSAAKSAYGNIVYRKAPSILRQAEFYLGEREFREAVRSLVRSHAYGNAEWADLVRAFERASGRKLDRWADAWVKRRGMPDVRLRLTRDARGRIKSLRVEQSDALGEGGSWPMRVKLLLAYENGARPETVTVMMNGAGGTEVREAVGRRRPDFVFANFEDYGYGRFLLDDESRRVVVENLGAVKDDFLRALLWGSLWDSVREAEFAPSDFIALAIEQAARERDDVALQFVLARAQAAFSRYLSDEQRRALAPRFERMLYERMMNAETDGQRITYFRTYRDAATTAEARDHLVSILEGRLKVPGVTLRSRDRFDLIRSLMASGDQRARALLKAQEAADLSDDARRYAYAAAAAWPDAAVKKRYFQQYLTDEKLPESWIEASFGPFNSPQQEHLTLPYLAPALRELPALKRTRKIFFINGWLSAFVGGQCDEAALKVVGDFLARGDLDRDLRLKVLENSDALERCARIRARYAGRAARPSS